MILIKKLASFLVLSSILILSKTSEASAQVERLCDTSFEDCRQPLWTLIDNETVGIDVSFWFIQDTSLSNKIIARFQAGVPVRILCDPRASGTYAGNQQILDQFRAAGIPMRYKVADCILHRKFMLFAGQAQVEFSGANYGPFFFVPNQPYTDYIDEAIYFTGVPSVLNSFKTIMDDMWTDTVNYGNYANITGALTRRYPTFPLDPELNFPPSADGSQSFLNRSQSAFNQETQKIDVIMYRITNLSFTDMTIAAVNRGIPVRLITEQNEYRNRDRPWDSYNVDLMYNAGVQIKIRAHQGLNHEKVAMLYGQGLTIFGSSNWTGPSANCQAENNYFTTKTWFFTWFVNQFERKWNASGETQPFTPLPPDAPVYNSPANNATGVSTNPTLSWEGGPYAHKFDIYFGTNPTPPLLAADQFIGAVDNGSVPETYALQNLAPGTRYYWRIVSKTMANMTATGPTWSFTTAGSPGGAPTLSSISPNSGSTAGGTSVTITGTNFATGATINIGGVAATNVNVTSSTSLTAVTPAHAAGTVSVILTNPDGQSATLPNSFTYATPPPPGQGDVVLYASESTVKVGNWSVVSDSTAAGGARMFNPDAGVAKLNDALRNPTSYFEMTFQAQAGTAYHLWIRGKAQADYWGNDSIFAQFSDSLDSSGGAAVFRIGTNSGTAINLEDCSGCGLQGWGWQDNGWGVGVMGPLIYFANSGTHTIRIQPREDGLSIDQIVLSPGTYLNTSPGALKNDTTILPKSGGGGTPAPSVASISPNTGSTSGGTAVSITGTGFVSGATVSLGGTAATNVTVTSSTTITAVTAAHAAGAVSVVATNPDGQRGTLANGFTYSTPQASAPTVTTVTPNSGPTTGGTSVTIAGTNFVSGANVTFGGTSAMNVSVTSSTSLTAVTPAHSAGAVNVAVINPDGQSGTLASGFTYSTPQAPAPTVTTVTPNSGPTTGGTSVTIAGTNFVSGANVTFGGTSATNVSVTSSTSLTAVTPAHSAGAVNVAVINPDGQSGTKTNGYTYTTPSAPAPTVTGVSPNTGSTAGGTSVTITGTNFVSGATVSFGGVAASNVNVTSGTSITAVAPPQAGGAVTVTVTNPDGQSGSLANAFTYSGGETVLLADDFNNNSLNLSVWNKTNLFSGFTDTSLPVSEVNQRLEIGPLFQGTGDSHYAGIRSVNSYDFTNAYCYVQIVQPAASATTADAMLTVGKDVNGYYRIYIEGSSLIFQKRISGAKTTLLTATFNSTSDRFWRIRHEQSTGNVVFETAPDNGGVPGTWSIRYSEQWNTSAVPLAAILFEIKGGTWQPESTAPGKVIFDNFRAAKP